MAASVGYRVNGLGADETAIVQAELKTLQLSRILEMAQIAADCKGSQAIYAGVDGGYGLINDEGAKLIARVYDRNSVVGAGLPMSGGGSIYNSTVTRFAGVWDEYKEALGRLKRRLATVVVYRERGLRATLEQHEDPEEYIAEVTGELYNALGRTGILAIDADSTADVLDLSLTGIETAILPWRQWAIAASGGLTEEQLWGASSRAVGLSGVDEQSRQATAASVRQITEQWEPIATYIARNIVAKLYPETDWAGVRVEFNRPDNPSMLESLQAQKLAAEADRLSIDMGTLTPAEIRASRHGGEGLGENIALTEEVATSASVSNPLTAPKANRSQPEIDSEELSNGLSF
jgi:hypothetical protein